MRLYERDYSVITEEEQEQEISITNEHTTYLGKTKVYNSGMYRKFPKAVRHFHSLFPNNFLDVVDLSNNEELHRKNDDYKAIIEDKDCIETDILRYIKDSKSYHIIGSILKMYRFGHHDAYLFPEFQLGNSYKADYLLVGKASGGYEFVFVELENPYGRITVEDGDFGDVIRKGIRQINDWKSWIEANYNSISETFQKDIDKGLPKEFYKYDSSRIHYVVVAGRRDDYTGKTYTLNRRLLKEQDINLLHYDNVYDLGVRIIGEATY